jgi:membrane protease YdiL (CAAX protease family)
MACVFIAGKILVNRWYGASWLSSVRSGLMGIIFYTLGCYAIHVLSLERKVDNEGGRAESRPHLYKATACFVIIAVVLTIEALNDLGSMSLRIPVWSTVNESWANLIRSWTRVNPNIEGIGIFGFPYLVLYVLLPALLLKRSGFRQPKVFGFKAAVPAFPFVAIYAASFIVVKGLSARSLLTLLFTVVWPAFGEEFFYRGLLQDALVRSTGNPVSSIAITSFLFAASHIPAYVFSSPVSSPLAWSSLLPIMATSFLWGYGYHRTGVLWPWVFIHAASNLVGF